MYVAVKGGEKAIDAARRLMDKRRRGAPELPEISLEQIREQLGLAVDRVMAEGSLYAPELAALAVKQAQGDLVEAIFLLRASRAAFPRFGYSLPVDTAAMRVERRISGTWKDLPGGQLLGPTFDYAHRLLDYRLARTQKPEKSVESAESAESAKSAESAEPEAGKPPSTPVPTHAGAAVPTHAAAVPTHAAAVPAHAPTASAAAHAPTSTTTASATPPPADEESLPDCPKAMSVLIEEGLLELEEDDGREPGDITRQPVDFPLDRPERLQNLARSDEGFALALAYSSQRGFGSVHPFVSELRQGAALVEFIPEELGFPVVLGEMEATECETVNQFKGGGETPPVFTRGYGLTFGRNERKALCMAIVDRALRAEELGEEIKGPAQNQEFVFSHSDNVEAAGFVSHIKLPHYVDFQAELSMLRQLRKAKQNDDRGDRI
ncbi:MAG: carbon-phosphorus lyase complex subunit PhnI [Deltaproteobacteria bacterium]|jgi:alpha-D-ribose 1-methylphosphonate 5-triphosphate synthase subunit PhnI|nr:carbon-phosphorus lyase complex subunit PhnI [Deltaproteobacteria bacterium]